MHIPHHNPTRNPKDKAHGDKQRILSGTVVQDFASKSWLSQSGGAYAGSFFEGDGSRDSWMSAPYDLGPLGAGGALF